MRVRFSILLIGLLYSSAFSQNTLSLISSALNFEDRSAVDFYLKQIPPSSDITIMLIRAEAFLLQKDTVQTSVLLRSLNNQKLSEGDSYQAKILTSEYLNLKNSFKEANSGLSKLKSNSKTPLRWQGKHMVVLAESLLDLGDFNGSLEALSKAEKEFVKDSVSFIIKLAKVSFLKGINHFYLSNFLEAEKCFLKSLRYYQSTPLDKSIDIGKVYVNLANTYLELGQYESAKTSYRFTIDFAFKGKVDSMLVASYYGNFARFYHRYGNLLESRKQYEMCFQFVKQSSKGEHSMLAKLFTNYATLLKDSYEFDAANLNLKKAKHYLTHSRESRRDLVFILINQAWIKMAQQQFSDAKMLIDSISPDLLIEFKEDDELLSNYYRLQGNLETATKAYRKAEISYSTAIRHSFSNPLTLAELWNDLADTHKLNNEFEKCLTAHRQALTYAVPIVPANSNFLTFTYNSMGIAHCKQRQFDSAKFYLKKALQVNTSVYAASFKEFSNYLNPFETLVSNYYLLDIGYKEFKNGTIDEVELSRYEAYILVSQGIIQQWRSILSPTDQIQFASLTSDFFDLAMDYYYEIAHLDPRNLEKAFQMSELSKQQLLLRLLRESKVNEFAGVTKAVQNKNDEYASIFSLLELQIAQELAYSDQVNKDLLIEYQQRWDFVKNKYSLFMDSLRTHLPSFYNLKFNTSLVSIEVLQSSILKPKSNKVLVEYYFGDSTAYCFLITPLARHLVKLKSKAPDLIRSIYAVRNNTKMQLSSEALTHSASLFKQLFAEIEKYLLSLKGETELIIIADGYTAQIPFELLATVLGKDWKDSKFLLHQFPISYSYSASLLWQEFSDRKPYRLDKSRMLAVAPDFGNKPKSTFDSEYRSAHDIYNFSPLRENISEVQKIKSLLKASTEVDLIVGNGADEANFRTKDLFTYNIIHFATHGFVNLSDENQSGIAFSHPINSRQDDILYMNEIYNLNSKADLVCLSACESGYGKVEKGEGLMSLSRAFQYAGSKNLLVSLWKVDDSATSTLMLKFYEQLVKKKTIPQALRAAKLSMLNNAVYSDPFMWSSFIHIGLN